MAIMEIGTLVGFVNFMGVVFIIGGVIGLVRSIGHFFGASGEETFTALGTAAGAGTKAAAKGAVRGGKYGAALGKGLWNKWFGKEEGTEEAQQETATLQNVEKDLEDARKQEQEAREKVDALRKGLLEERGELIRYNSILMEKEQELAKRYDAETDPNKKIEILEALEGITKRRIAVLEQFGRIDIGVLREVKDLEKHEKNIKDEMEQLAARAQFLRNRAEGDMRAAATTAMREGRAAKRAAGEAEEGAEDIKKDLTKEAQIIDECQDIAIKLMDIQKEIGETRKAARTASREEARPLFEKIQALKNKESMERASLDSKMSELMRINTDIANNFKSRVAPAGDKVLRLLNEIGEPLKVAEALAEKSYKKAKEEEKELKGAME